MLVLIWWQLPVCAQAHHPKGADQLAGPRCEKLPLGGLSGWAPTGVSTTHEVLPSWPLRLPPSGLQAWVFPHPGAFSSWSSSSKRSPPLNSAYWSPLRHDCLQEVSPAQHVWILKLPQSPLLSPFRHLSDQCFSTWTILSPGDIWQCLETFGCHNGMGERMLLVFSGYRLEMLLNILQCIGQPHKKELSSLKCH